jgi:alkaline phosphatase D
MQPSRENIMTLRAIVLQFLAAFTLVSPMAAAADAEPKVLGPLLGHTDADSATLWARIPTDGNCRAELREVGVSEWRSIEAKPSPDHDFCVTWAFGGLKPATQYEYRIRTGGDEATGNGTHNFTTSPAPDVPARISLAFGSCAKEDAGSAAVWDQVRASAVDGVVLMGDTPYIDTTDLAKQRARHRAFNAVPAFQRLAATTPFWGTWDDHDFGKNDGDGTLPGKENVRKAFMEYRANASYGTGDEGIYTSFRRGPIEVFLIDARWWSWTGPSFADPDKKPLLGDQQWEWLKDALRNSNAPFKILASGIIWDDKENAEKDDWHTYAHEREALFGFIRAEKISGVVLLGGDIHVSRVLRYGTTDQVGYPLYQFITSPVHAGVIASLNVPNPALIRDAEEPHTFLTLTADTALDPPTLNAAFINKEGNRIFEDVTVSLDELQPK